MKDYRGTLDTFQTLSNIFIVTIIPLSSIHSFPLILRSGSNNRKRACIRILISILTLPSTHLCGYVLVTYWLYPNDTYPKYDEKWLRIIRQPFVKQPIVSGLVMHSNNDNYPRGGSSGRSDGGWCRPCWHLRKSMANAWCILALTSSGRWLM